MVHYHVLFNAFHHFHQSSRESNPQSASKLRLIASAVRSSLFIAFISHRKSNSYAPMEIHDFAKAKPILSIVLGRGRQGTPGKSALCHNRETGASTHKCIATMYLSF